MKETTFSSSRTIKSFHLPEDVEPRLFFNVIGQYLTQMGFYYQVYAGENIFKKGIGFFGGPIFVKLSFGQDSLQLDVWGKFAILPGIYVGEFKNGTALYQVSYIQKRLVPELTSLMLANGATETTAAPTYMQPTFPQYNTNVHPASMQNPTSMHLQPPTPSNFYTGTTQTNDHAAQQIPLTKKAFREQCLPSFVKNLRSFFWAIYIVLGIYTMLNLIDFLFNPDILHYNNGNAGYFFLEILNVAILDGLAPGMYLGRSKLCAFILLVDSGVQSLFLFAQTDSYNYFLYIVVLCAIGAIISFFSADKKYKQYLTQTNPYSGGFQ